MRSRFAALFGLMIAMALIIGVTSPTHLVRAQDDATPEAEAAPEVDQDPAAGVVTLVAWYYQDPSGEFLNITPLETDQDLNAAPTDPDVILGTVDFESEDNVGRPRITLGDSVFDSYPVYSDNPESLEQWIYFNDDSGLRPAVLVMQVEATAGPYQGGLGQAIFVSRAHGAGGVVTIVLNTI